MQKTESGVSTAAVEAMLKRERDRFLQANPRSAKLGEQARAHWNRGVPMHWMLDWSTPFPLFAKEAKGATLTDVDGHDYADFCLGDTGSMLGHSPEPVVQAIREQAGRGLTYMLPTEDVPEVGRMLAEMFGLPYWQIATTATDANRFVIRLCRAITKRPKVLVFNGCYHGAVDDTFLHLKDGKPANRAGLMGQVYDLTQGTVVIEFNDLKALEAALGKGDVACILAEPALTNVGMVLPEPGFLDGMAALAKQYGTLLIIDETHTISTGYGGYTRMHGLTPDFFTLGKPVAGGIPCSVFGSTAEMAGRIKRAEDEAGPGYSGIGTTLSANALQLHAMRANLTHVMTRENYRHMLDLSDRLAKGITAEIEKRKVPWHVSNVGARAEFVCSPVRPKNGGEAKKMMQPKLELAVHLFLLNRGVLIAPFHNMTLASPATSAAQVDHLVATVGACFDELA
jgi:glutamate-1-semialdehyde 2,1-aminomutase